MDGTVPRIELVEWWARFGIVAGMTTRGAGFDLGLWTEGGPAVMNRWGTLGAEMRPRFPALVIGHQVHGAALAWHDGAASGLLIAGDLDGHATDATGLLLTVTVADCVPVYLAVPRAGALALVHAGWRGVAAGILEGAVGLLVERTGAPAGEIVMHCGVGICGGCYEVGPEVLACFKNLDAPSGHLDLRAVLARQAAALGVGERSQSPWCTAHDRNRFFSHRASRGQDGRMAAYLGRPRS